MKYRIKEWVRLRGATLSHLVQPLCSSTVSLEHRIVCRQFSNIFCDGDSSLSLGNLSQCSVTCTVQKLFLMLRWNFCASVLAHCILSYGLAPPGRAWFHSLSTLLYRHGQEQTQLPQKRDAPGP